MSFFVHLEDEIKSYEINIEKNTTEILQSCIGKTPLENICLRSKNGAKIFIEDDKVMAQDGDIFYISPRLLILGGKGGFGATIKVRFFAKCNFGSV